MDTSKELSNIYLCKYAERSVAGSGYHYDLPEAIRENPIIAVIVRAELDAKDRKFGKRGYDVIRNCFFVEQTIKTRKYCSIDQQIVICTTFNTFEDYYTYLAGDIYSRSNYFGYSFSDAEKAVYALNTSKLSTGYPKIRTLEMCSKSKNAKKQRHPPVIPTADQELVKHWIDIYSNIKSYDEFIKHYRSSKEAKYYWEQTLPNIIRLNAETIIPIYLKFLLEDHQTTNRPKIAMLCILYGKDDIFALFPGKLWKLRSEMRAIFKDYQSGLLVREQQKFYDERCKKFCFTERVFDPRENALSQIKACISFRYRSFEEFSEAINYDLSDTDLTNTDITDLNLAQYKINEKTRLPSKAVPNLIYSVDKRYDPKKDIFIVEESWRIAPNAPVQETRKYEMKYYGDFVAFLKKDLSYANLLFCEGLCNVANFTGINFAGAKLHSTIKKRVGIWDEADRVVIPEYTIIEPTLTHELVLPDLHLSSHPALDSEEKAHYRKIHYISDLHLPQRISAEQCISSDDIEATLCKTALEVSRDLCRDDILLIAGDTSCDIKLFTLFIKKLRWLTEAHIIFILGNHELWPFENSSFPEIVATYKKLLTAENMYLLQNGILFQARVDQPFEEITEDALSDLDINSLRAKVAPASTIFFGGLGFSGKNDCFNADYGIYKDAITRTEEIKYSQDFEKLYTKIRDSLTDRNVIIATHMPLSDWSTDTTYHSKYVYVSGHTHKNTFYDDGMQRIYADNQVGYHRRNAYSKYFYSDIRFDPFAEYGDGIYEISRHDYLDFYLGKNIHVQFTRDFEHLYILKRSGYYCFMIETEKGTLAILNKGSTKQIKKWTIQGCYEEMPSIIEEIKDPLDQYTAVQLQISSLVKSIGGCGRIHGAIIDIDYYNHIYLNPNDHKATCYYADNMRDKLVYRNLHSLIAAHRGDMLPAYLQYLTSENRMHVPYEEQGLSISPIPYKETDIYLNSNKLKKMQLLYSNVLTIWPD